MTRPYRDVYLPAIFIKYNKQKDGSDEPSFGLFT